MKFLSEDDIENYTMHDIVLPLPGFDVKYPENEVKQWYKELLQEYGLELEMTKQKVKLVFNVASKRPAFDSGHFVFRTYTLSGAYRKIIEKVSNLSWYTLQYNDPNYNLIRSDYEELQGEEEPKSVEGGKYKALIIDMCLTSSNYATMVLREVLKIDTSTASQTKLNDYHEKNKIEASSSDAPVSQNEKSLLDSPDKFALFKKLVFDDGDDLKRKMEDEPDGVEKKRVKTEEKEGDEVSKKVVIADVI